MLMIYIKHQCAIVCIYTISHWCFMYIVLDISSPHIRLPTNIQGRCCI